MVYFVVYFAVRTQAPPTALIFSSALLEKNLALTMTGCLGRTPLPSTYNTHQLFRLLLEKPN